MISPGTKAKVFFSPGILLLEGGRGAEVFFFFPPDYFFKRVFVLIFTLSNCTYAFNQYFTVL